MNFCQSSCKYDGVDLDINRFLCNCDSDFKNNNENIDQYEYIEEVEANFITYILGMINYKIFIFNHLLFNIDNKYWILYWVFYFIINFNSLPLLLFSKEKKI